MAAAVTGATGFLGRHLLAGLAPSGAPLRALVRRPADAAALRARGITPVLGDLTVPGAAAGLVQPGDVVYHAAARVDMIGRWEDFVEGTIATTRNLLATVLPQRPARFVYVSSAGVYVRGTPAGPVCADRVPARPSRYNFYGRAKLAAEELVRTECSGAGCPWVVLRLGFLYGPGNQALYRRLVPLSQRGRLFIIGPGTNRIATLYIADAVDAVLRAGTHPAAANRVYDVASSEPVTQQQFLDGLTECLGLPACRRRVPSRLAMAATGLAELWSRLAGGAPAFSRAMVALMGADQQVDSSAIERELDWRPRFRFAEAIQASREIDPHRDARRAGPPCPAPDPDRDRKGAASLSVEHD